MNLRNLFVAALCIVASLVNAAEIIRISTHETDLVFRVGNDGRLYQAYLGKHLKFESDLQHLPNGKEAYLTHGMEDYFEPALDVRHVDGNASTLLKYVSHTSNKTLDGATETIITLRDPVYSDNCGDAFCGLSRSEYHQDLYRNHQRREETCQAGQICQ